MKVWFIIDTTAEQQGTNCIFKINVFRQAGIHVENNELYINMQYFPSHLEILHINIYIEREHERERKQKKLDEKTGKYLTGV